MTNISRLFRRSRLIRISKLSLIPLIASLLLLSNCGTLDPRLTVYDKEVCSYLGDVVYQGVHIAAHCKHTLTSDTRNVTVLDWTTKPVIQGGGVEMLCINSQGFADSESDIDQACQILQCDYKQRESLLATAAVIRQLRKNKTAAEIRKPLGE